MEITQNPWHYTAPDQAGRSNRVPSIPTCRLLKMYCYFLPLSSCPVQPIGTYDRNYDYRHPPLLPPRAQRWLPAYIVRPQTWLRYDVFQYLQNNQIQQRQQQETMTKKNSTKETTTTATDSAAQDTKSSCTVLHVRRGDVIQHGNISRRYHALSEYLDVVDKNILGSTYQHGIHPPHKILLLTDDANVILESQSYQNRYHFMYFDRPRFHDDEGGWEHQLPSSQPKFEMIVLWSTFEWVKDCSSIVHSTSGFSNWIIWEMTKVHGDNLHVYNLDQNIPKEQLYGEHNIRSKSISTNPFNSTT